MTKHAGSFRAAFAELGITPQVSPEHPVQLQGMDGPPRMAVETTCPLSMSFLLLEDANSAKCLVVAADIFGFDPQIVELTQQICSNWGLPPEAIFLNASHTHYGPGTIFRIAPSLGPGNTQFVQMLVNATNQAMELLYNELGPCLIEQGACRCQIGVNRRLPSAGKIDFAPNPPGAYDNYTPFLKLKFARSGQQVVIVNHGCHPTGLGSAALLSADYPGYMRQYLKAKSQVHGVMFLQGAAGSSKAVIPGNPSCFAQSSHDVLSAGENLAKELLRAMNSSLRLVNGDIVATSVKCELPVKPLPGIAELNDMLNNENNPPMIRAWANAMLNERKHREINKILLRLQVMSLGNSVYFIGLGGEPCAELALRLRELVPETKTAFILGYTNGLAGYLPTAEMVKDGGYETGISHFAYLLPPYSEEAENTILQTTRNCMEKIARSDRIDIYGRHHRIKRKGDAFFVMSAGRCGTLTMAYLLDTAANAKVWHHPLPFMVEETLQAWMKEGNLSEMFWRGRGQFIFRTWSRGMIHGETDLNMTPFCGMLAKEILHSKFIILTRNPYDFVRSGMRRMYYRGHMWDHGRLRPTPGTHEYTKWLNYSPFEKICWLWAETHRRIIAMSAEINAERIMRIRIEDLIKHPTITRQIFTFLGLSGYDSRKAWQILSHKHNEQTSGDFPIPENWPDAQKQILAKHCADMAVEFGYEIDGRYRCTRTGKPRNPGLKSHTTDAAAASAAAFIRKKPAAVCVGLPVYSGGEMLADAIHSILSQDFEDLELIVSDHGSDPLVRETCEEYRNMDTRLTYIHTDDNIRHLGIRNLARMIELCRSPFFMWGSYDDRMEPAYIAECMKAHEQDESVALVYSHSWGQDPDGNFCGICRDELHADQADPLERFKNVIWELFTCNAYYGLFRTRLLRKCRTMQWKMFRANDNLLLAETALKGKIVQLDDILFRRVITRNVDNIALEQHNADILNSVDPMMLEEGITLPYCRFSYAHVELVNYSTLSCADKERMTREVVKCFRTRWDTHMRGEISRVMDLVNRNCYYYTWDGRSYPENEFKRAPGLLRFHLSDLVKHLQEVRLFYPEWDELRRLQEKCLKLFANTHESET